jgi:Outer membrane efflux protein
MNRIIALLALALLGMDDPQRKPDASPKGPTNAADCICERVKDLKQVDPAGGPGIQLPQTLPGLIKPRTPSSPPAQEAWPLTLRDAIRIAMDNSEITRVIAFGAQGAPIGCFDMSPSTIGPAAKASDVHRAPMVIQQLDGKTDPWRWRAEIAAHIRSVEQRYWNLAQAHVQLWAADRAVNLAQEILNREQAELTVGRGTPANVAEAAQRLEQFNLDLVTRTSDVLTTERQLRNILGLPPADNRRITPVTPPSEAKLEPVWDTCLHEMLEHSPEIAQRKMAVGKLRDTIAIASVVAPVSSNTAPLGQQVQDATLVDPDIRQRLAQQEAELQRTIQQQAQSLARFFLEIDAEHKQLQTAKRLRAAAANRLDAQRAYYEEGRITLDRFLDAVGQYAGAVAAEAQYMTTYNVAVVALREVKGTLLFDYGIAVAELKPRHDLAGRQPRTDGSATPAAFLGPDKSGPQLPVAPPAATKPSSDSECCASKDAANSAHPTTATQSWTFSFTIGSGPNPIQITGTISAGDHAKPGP